MRDLRPVRRRALPSARQGADLPGGQRRGRVQHHQGYAPQVHQRPEHRHLLRDGFVGSLRDAGARRASGAASPTIFFESTPLPGDAIAFHGLGVQQPCGGRGVCGKCAVWVGAPSGRRSTHRSSFRRRQSAASTRPSPARGPGWGGLCWNDWGHAPRRLCRSGRQPAGRRFLGAHGHATMLYSLTGRSSDSLSHALFHADTLFGRLAPLMGGEAYLLPCRPAACASTRKQRWARLTRRTPWTRNAPLLPDRPSPRR